MYIRTDIGINKILDNRDGLIATENFGFITEKEIIKASFNLIDLVEVDDEIELLDGYGNNTTRFVVYKHRDPRKRSEELAIKNYRFIPIYEINPTDIKTILTHERFENDCYKVEEEI